jgi:hypothetical protein
VPGYQAEERKAASSPPPDPDDDEPFSGLVIYKDAIFATVDTPHFLGKALHIRLNIFGDCHAVLGHQAKFVRAGGKAFFHRPALALIQIHKAAMPSPMIDASSICPAKEHPAGGRFSPSSLLGSGARAI